MSDVVEPLDVAIIGAGFAGIGIALRLHQRGVSDFAILERDTRVGGTWRDNTYPGAACDIPSRLYSYSFAPNPDWSKTYSGSGEILDYIENMVDSFGLRPFIRFGHNVTGLEFDEAEGLWSITIDGRDKQLRARSVLVASGPLSNASFPAIPGIDDFEGKKVHSARWDHDYDYAGKKVAVVGTGASAVQIVPELVKTAASVKVHQRTPGWVLPRINRETSGLAKKLYQRFPVTQSLVRGAWFWGHETVALGVVWESPLTRVVERVAELHLRAQVRDPWLRRQLTPDFRAGCKRLLMSSDYYPALQADNCRLNNWPIVKIVPEGILTAEGVVHRADCIVFATGFEVSKSGAPIPITGRGGRKLDDEWSRGSYAFKSVAVAGYPNLFFTFGPNSGPGHNSALVYMEAQIEYIAEAISVLLGRDLRTLEVDKQRQDEYNVEMQRRLASTTWNSGCSSWYLTEDGFNATMYPGFGTQFVRQLDELDLDDYVITARVRAEMGDINRMPAFG